MGSGNSVASPRYFDGAEGRTAINAMLKETPLGKVLTEADLQYFSTFFTIETMQPHCHVPMCAGELLVVGEGEVQVYIIQAGLDNKTGEQKFMLCTKRKGDLIWVPTVSRLATQNLSQDGVHKDLYNVMDTTFVDSLYGAVLLKLDRKKYEALSQGSHPSSEEVSQLDLVAIRRVIDCNMEDYLRKVPLFQYIPPAKVAVLGQMCNYEFVKAGKTVCQEGEAGTEVFIILDGRLAVHTMKGDQLVPLADLGPGGYFGELASLARIKRIATVVATEDTMLASIKRHDFRSFLAILPGVRKALERDVKDVLLFKYSKTGNPFFPPPAFLLPQTTPPTPTTRPSEGDEAKTADGYAETKTSEPAVPKDPSKAHFPISDLCDIDDVDAGRVIIYQGDSPGCLYYITEGQVRLQRKEDNTDEVLGPGSIVGGRSLVLNVPQPYTAVTDQICVFLRLSREALDQHFQACPEVKALMQIRFRGRRTPLVTLLQYREARAAFAAHLKEELATEHLSYYDDVVAYDSLMSIRQFEAAQLLAQNILDAYLAEGAANPINIPDSMRQRILAEFGRDVSSSSSSSTTELEASLQQKNKLFNDAKREVLTLMEKDNYSRFKNSALFESMFKSLQTKLPSEPLPEADVDS